MRSHVNILLLLIGLFSIVFATHAQEKKKDEADTAKIKPSYIPTGVRIGTDLISLARTPFDDTFNGWEINGDVDFYRYYFAVDYGHWERSWVHESVGADNVDRSDAYSNRGNYWRVGADVNFLTKDPDRNMFFLGLRYARSKFSETMIYTSNDKVWGSNKDIAINTNVPAGWLELTTGLRVKIWKIIWLGYTARLKFALKTGSTSDMAPSDVPGYGRADKDSYWGFNYQIFVRIPTRKMPPLPTLKK